MSLFLFEKLPLGTRIRYPGNERVWTILEQSDATEKGCFGLLAEYRPGMYLLGRWQTQQTITHDPSYAPNMVEVID